MHLTLFKNASTIAVTDRQGLYLKAEEPAWIIGPDDYNIDRGFIVSWMLLEVTRDSAVCVLWVWCDEWEECFFM